MTDSAKDEPVVLTIAGFDPSGGAGMIADIKTIQSFGGKPVAAITSITFQNSKEVFGAISETAESIRAQVLPIVEEHQVAALKIGMLPTSEIVLEVARLIAEADLPAPVLDPVMRSSSGYSLIEEDAVGVLIRELLPLARVITPNIPEAEKLSGITITTVDEMHEAAAKIRALGALAALVKGGHLAHDSGKTTQAIDLLDDQDQVSVLREEWVAGGSMRGTGCILSSAIAAGLAHEKSLAESVRDAKNFVADAIRQARRA